MPQQAMAAAEALEFLAAQEVGRLGSVDPAGIPYITPVHYLYQPGNIYFHSSLQGKKLDNIAAQPRVCFEVSAIDKRFIHDEACRCGTRYTSVLVFGRAELIVEQAEKMRILQALTEKYVTGHAVRPVTAAGASGCAVVTIRIDEIQGKRNIDPTA